MPANPELYMALPGRCRAWQIEYTGRHVIWLMTKLLQWNTETKKQERVIARRLLCSTHNELYYRTDLKK
jgi:hypothetical protein